MFTLLVFVALRMVELTVIGRVLLRRHREPASRVAWVVVILVLPLLGMLTYLLLGETSIGKRRGQRLRKITDSLPSYGDEEARAPTGESPRFDHLSTVASAISHMKPVGGNRGALMADSNATIEALVADIDAAERHVHLLFYIWLDDHNGMAVVEALKRAAGRGVVCRAIADGLGSRAMVESKHWRDMREAGVKLAVALKVSGPIFGVFRGRVDLRNHRKIVVIDDRITYCGSQNCADPEFRIKAKFAPWVDVVIRFEGPIARQNQRLFVADWMESAGEDLRWLLHTEPPGLETASAADMPAVSFGTGPTYRYSAMPEMFEAAFYAAHNELVITTPYYVPNDAMQQALCGAAYRGVDVTIVFPARNDSWIVAAASRSYYEDLLEAGVKIHEYVGGLLHAKTCTVDNEVTLIGSANMDRRSFDLNYENNILFRDPALTADLRSRQQSYLASSRPVSLEEVRAWPRRRKLWNNAISMLGPVL